MIIYLRSEDIYFTCSFLRRDYIDNTNLTCLISNLAEICPDRQRMSPTEILKKETIFPGKDF